MTQSQPGTPATTKPGFGALARKYWLPTLLTVLAIVFIVQNTGNIAVNLFNRTLSAPAWIIYTALVLVGMAVGWFLQRRRIKRRTGLR